MTHQSEGSQNWETRDVVQTQLQQWKWNDNKIKNIPAFFEVIFWTHGHHFHHSLHSKCSRKELKWICIISQNINESSHIVSMLKSLIHRRVHIMMIQCHEGRVDHDTKSYEKVNKRIKDNEGEELGQFDVPVAAVPHTHHLETLNTKVADFLFQPGTE